MNESKLLRERRSNLEFFLSMCMIQGKRAFKNSLLDNFAFQLQKASSVDGFVWTDPKVFYWESWPHHFPRNLEVVTLN